MQSKETVRRRGCWTQQLFPVTHGEFVPSRTAAAGGSQRPGGQIADHKAGSIEVNLFNATWGAARRVSSNPQPCPQGDIPQVEAAFGQRTNVTPQRAPGNRGDVKSVFSFGGSIRR